MDDGGLVILRLYGLDARNGRVPTDAFTGMIRRFAATIAIFERAYTERRNRSTELNVTSLARENPLVIGLRPEPRVAGYSPTPAMIWTFNEIERIGLGQAPDARVPLEAIDNLIALSDIGDGMREDIAAFSASFNSKRIGFDDGLAKAATAQRKEALARIPAPAWFAGVSKGVLVGELRGVTDLQGEREFFIRKVTGGQSVRCIFPEEMRPEMNRLLFQPVRIEGFLRYDGTGPNAQYVEATSILDLNESERPHLYDRPGLFRDSYYARQPEFPQ